MVKYLTLHYELTIARKLAQEELKKGPRLAIVGGETAGTSFAARLMLNYAGKLNMRPIYVDLDLDNSIFLDGSIGAAAYQYKVTTSEDLF
jgi:polynucleotide 5'-kinase involved in rRNA processing